MSKWSREAEWSFTHGCQTPQRGFTVGLRWSLPWGGDSRQPHSLEVNAFSQIREAPRRLLSTSVDLQMSSAHNDLPANSGVPSGSDSRSSAPCVLTTGSSPVTLWGTGWWCTAQVRKLAQRGCYSWPSGNGWPGSEQDSHPALFDPKAQLLALWGKIIQEISECILVQLSSCYLIKLVYLTVNH